MGIGYDVGIIPDTRYLEKNRVPMYGQNHLMFVKSFSEKDLNIFRFKYLLAVDVLINEFTSIKTNIYKEENKKSISKQNLMFMLNY